MTGRTLVMAIERHRNMVDQATTLGRHNRFGRHPIGREAMTGGTVEGKIGGLCMAFLATDAHPTNPVQRRSMTQGTGRLSILSRVMEGVIRSGPMGRMCIVHTVTLFTAGPRRGSSRIIDPDIKTGIAARPTSRIT